MAKLTKEEILSAIEEMTVLELSDLVKAIEEKFGVSAAAPVAFAGAVAGAVGGGAAPAAEEKTEFEVILKSFPADKKINIIKELRAITNLGLKEAKDKVEAAPTSIKAGIPKAEAEDIKKKLEAAGAEIEIK
ncbi:MAG TPA: 50S ribosomal protein L7/L12 [bacterium]|nr:50S ribosomal protein L7/L12 [bacterium]HOL48139.1 50S ribosomal protein L7/L12 [bacterium]HPQ18537.1 50S ribosomal protein L7/L12 [bacterium]